MKIIFHTVWVVLLSLVLFSGSIGSAAEEKKAAPAIKKSANVQAWNCAGCHTGQKMLPATHVDVKEMPYEGCLVCHIPGEGNAGTLRVKVPGSHLHTLRGVKCGQCHEDVKQPEAVEMDKCLACHSPTATLAEKTKDIKPHNPHTSPHYGTDLDCNLCHHQHAKSENYCLQCHKFDFIVP